MKKRMVNLIALVVIISSTFCTISLPFLGEKIISFSEQTKLSVSDEEEE
jgi:hypothetical protein